MTAPDPTPEPAGGAALFEQAVLWRRVAGELDAAVAGTAALAAEIAASWTDRAGQGWVQRLELVGRELDRQAGVAGDIVRLVTAWADGVGGPVSPAGPYGAGPYVAGPTVVDPPIADHSHPDRGHPDRSQPDRSQSDRGQAGPGGVGPHGGAGDGAAPSWTLPGARLGGTDGTRASERRGVVVPTLPDQPGG